MPAGLQRKNKQGPLIFAAAAIAVIICDQATKLWALSALAPSPERPFYTAISVIPNVLRLLYAENTGAAFSMFRGHPEVLTGIACLLALGVLVWSFLLPRNERLSRVALGLVFGGAVGNLLDRFRLGFVVDFVDVHWKGKQMWPTFNVADSAICVGIALFLLSTLLETRRAAAAARLAPPSAEPAPEQKKSRAIPNG